MSECVALDVISENQCVVTNMITRDKLKAKGSDFELVFEDGNAGGCLAYIDEGGQPAHLDLEENFPKVAFRTEGGEILLRRRDAGAEANS